MLTEYSIKNSKGFSRIGGKTRIIRIIIYALLAAVPVLIALFAADMICCAVFGPNIGEGIGSSYSEKSTYRYSYSEQGYTETGNVLLY